MSNPVTPATFKQAYHLLGLGCVQDVSLETLQELYRLGVLSDVFGVENTSRINREAVRIGLGYDPSVFRTMIGGPENTDDIVKILREGGFQVDYNINQGNFPLVPRETPEEDEIVIHDSGTRFYESGGLAILKKAKLERPTYEHAIRFVHQHRAALTSMKNDRFMVFLHEPRRDNCVLCVSCYSGKRELYLRDLASGFGVGHVLGGIQPRKSA